MRRAATSSALRQCQRGVSLVELMIGTAVSLVIVAAGSTLMLSNLREQKALLREAALMQNLRTAADVVSRDLRRAGFWDHAVEGVGALSGEGVVNPHAEVDLIDAPSGFIRFGYSRDTDDPNVSGDAGAEPRLGFRLRSGAIEIDLGQGNWQTLTDRGRLVVTAFHLTPRVAQIDLGSHCAKACDAGNDTCPPRQQLRSLAVEIAGRLPETAGASRALRTEVRLRNDAIVGTCQV